MIKQCIYLCIYIDTLFIPPNDFVCIYVFYIALWNKLPQNKFKAILKKPKIRNYHPIHD